MSFFQNIRPNWGHFAIPTKYFLFEGMDYRFTESSALYSKGL